MEKEYAKFKLNGGFEAMLCSGCDTIIKYIGTFTKRELRASKGEIKIKPMYCDKCKLTNKNK